MARPGPKSRIKAALERVNAEIRRTTDQTSMYSRGLSSEGWSGGYAAALRDVQLVLNGVKPQTRDYWNDWRGADSATGGP